VNGSGGCAPVSAAAANYAGVWGHRIGFGQSPALLVVDFVRAYTEPDSPLYAPGVGPAVQACAPLLARFRQRKLPVVHTTVRHTAPDFEDGGMWVRKAPVLRCFAEPRYAQVCEGVEPAPGEVRIVKQYASAFFGTSLAALLAAQRVDTVVLVGCTTSGCIRASAVDAVQHGFRVIVPRECVGDRHTDPHVANLFDIDSKYGDVVAVQDVLQHMAG
jgi:maleamate amidohydrolase